MALRGKKPTLIEKRLKALFYGQAGVGKTTCAIQFPRPYLIDTERGAENDQYVKLLNESGGAYFFTTDPDDLISEIKTLLSEKHEYKTLIIDPLTVIYNDLLDKAADKVGTDFGKHKGPADRKIKHLLTLLLRLDMNVIITAHAKPKWVRGVKDGKETVVEEGNTFDCYGRLDYLFDLVFEIQKRGKERIGIVKKTRIKGFEDGEQFPFNYNTIAEKYGREVLERDAIPQILATTEQAIKLKNLIEVMKVPEEIYQKWLDSNDSQTFDEIPADKIETYINYLQSKIQGA
jgi:hypothetical protein